MTLKQTIFKFPDNPYSIVIVHNYANPAFVYVEFKISAEAYRYNFFADVMHFCSFFKSMLFETTYNPDSSIFQFKFDIIYLESFEKLLDDLENVYFLYRLTK